MPQNKPHVGAEEIKQDSGAIPIEGLPTNKTLFVTKLNNEEGEVTPVRCRNLKEVFEQFKPTQEVALSRPDGTEETIDLKFTKMDDYSASSIMSQSKSLTEANVDKDVLDDLAKQLNKNTTLKKLLAEPAKKKLFLELIEKNLELLGGSTS
jgi:predicted component of type VI protein secretion system